MLSWTSRDFFQTRGASERSQCCNTPSRAFGDVLCATHNFGCTLVDPYPSDGDTSRLQEALEAEGEFTAAEIVDAAGLRRARGLPMRGPSVWRMEALRTVLLQNGWADAEVWALRGRLLASRIVHLNLDFRSEATEDDYLFECGGAPCLVVGNYPWQHPSFISRTALFGARFAMDTAVLAPRAGSPLHHPEHWQPYVEYVYARWAQPTLQVFVISPRVPYDFTIKASQIGPHVEFRDRNAAAWYVCLHRSRGGVVGNWVPPQHSEGRQIVVQRLEWSAATNQWTDIAARGKAFDARFAARSRIRSDGCGGLVTCVKH